MLPLTLSIWTSSSINKKNYNTGFKWVVLSLFATLTYSRETPNPYRDFSKLRLEGQESLTSTTPRDNFYYSTGTATEDVGVMFKPNHNDNMDSLSYNSHSDDEDPYNNNEMIPTASSQTNQPSLQNEDEMPMPIHTGGRGSSDINGGGGQGIADYSNNDKIQQEYGKHSGNNQDEIPTPEDMVFIPAPPSQSFIAEIEYDSATGTLHEQGAGGLYENNDQDSDYFYNNQDPDIQSPQNNDQNNEYNHRQEDHRRSYGYNDQGGGDHHISNNGGGGGNERLNGYEHHNGNNRDYRDY